MDNVLATLLGSKAKAKLLRFFTARIEHASVDDIAQATKIKPEAIKKELRPLIKIGLISEKTCTVKKDKKLKTKTKTQIKKVKCFEINPNFKYLRAVRHLVSDIDPADEKEILAKLKKAGNIKLALLSGVFLNTNDARVDIFVVADSLNEKALEKAIEDIESFVGKEIRYTAFTTKDFKYRISMYDRLLRDILDNPYKEILDKLSFSDWRDLTMS